MITMDNIDVNWKAVWDRAKELRGTNEIKPVDEKYIADALYELEDDIGLAGGPINDAVAAGIFEQHGDDSDAAYSVEDLDKLNATAEEDDEEERPEPIQTEETELPDSLTREDDPDWPALMTYRDEWVMGVAGEKQPRAPWEGSGLYPAEWRSELPSDDRPEQDFESVCNWVEYANRAGRKELGRPEDIETDRKCVPAYLLPPTREMLENRRGYVIVFIDFDDVVREDGTIVPEARELLERLNSVTEYSMSGTGFHTFVAIEEPFGPKEIKEDLNCGEGEIEIYQTSRFAAMTGEFVSELPSEVAEKTAVVEDIIGEYHEPDQTADEMLEEDLTARDDDYDDYNGDYSKYWSVDCTKFVDDTKKEGGKYRGSHPAHGSSNGNNIAITSNGEHWACHRGSHDSGGNALHLVATMEGYLDCAECGKNSLKMLDDTEFAQLCMDARDNHTAFNSDWKPPKRALVGVAKHFGFNEGDDITKGCYDMARRMYDRHTSADL